MELRAQIQAQLKLAETLKKLAEHAGLSHHKKGGNGWGVSTIDKLFEELVLVVARSVTKHSTYQPIRMEPFFQAL